MTAIEISKYTITVPIEFGNQRSEIKIDLRSCDECGAVLFPDMLQKHVEFHDKLNITSGRVIGIMAGLKARLGI